jgi:alanine-glyoxylate transaminase/serine-glyoxylate transaminase/serine-pyruvate transaminase
LAGGLHPDARNDYFRIGHMGPTKVGDLLATIGAVEGGLRQCGHQFDLGVGLAAAQAGYHEAMSLASV